jgi:hypothetical protein
LTHRRASGSRANKLSLFARDPLLDAVGLQGDLPCSEEHWTEQMFYPPVPSGRE